MARLRSDTKVPEVFPTISDEERRRLAHAISYDTDGLPVVPPELRSTGEAARMADEMCLRRLGANATACGASRAMAKDSSLGD